jgi:hypothetical protein
MKFGGLLIESFENALYAPVSIAVGSRSNHGNGGARRNDDDGFTTTSRAPQQDSAQVRSHGEDRELVRLAIRARHGAHTDDLLGSVTAANRAATIKIRF